MVFPVGRLDFPSGSFTGTLDVSALTGNQTYDLPDQSGTIALLSDIGASVLGTAKAPVDYITDADLNLTAGLTGLSIATIEAGLDGNPTLADGDRILVADEGGDKVTAAPENGIYVVSSYNTPAGQMNLSRATDLDEDAELTTGVQTTVLMGSGGASDLTGLWYVPTEGTLTVGTTPIIWARLQVSGVDNTSIEYDTNGKISIADGGITPDMLNFAAPEVAVVEILDGALVGGVYTFAHNVGSQYGTLQVYDENDNQLLPDEITLTDANNADIDLNSFTVPATTPGYRAVFVAEKV